MPAKPKPPNVKRKPQGLEYELALEKENLRLQREVARLKAEIVTVKNQRIAEFENTPIEKLTADELLILARKRGLL